MRIIHISIHISAGQSDKILMICRELKEINRIDVPNIFHSQVSVSKKKKRVLSFTVIQQVLQSNNVPHLKRLLKRKKASQFFSILSFARLFSQFFDRLNQSLLCFSSFYIKDLDYRRNGNIIKGKQTINRQALEIIDSLTILLLMLHLSIWINLNK